MKTLNLQRAELVFNDIIKSLRQCQDAGMLETEFAERVMSVPEVQAREVFVSPYKTVFSGTFLLMSLTLNGGHHRWVILTPLDKNSKPAYVIAVDLASRAKRPLVGSGIAKAQVVKMC